MSAKKRLFFMAKRRAESTGFNRLKREINSLVKRISS
jgi:hypothetical protein